MDCGCSQFCISILLTNINIKDEVKERIKMKNILTIIASSLFFPLFYLCWAVCVCVSTCQPILTSYFIDKCLTDPARHPRTTYTLILWYTFHSSFSSFSLYTVRCLMRIMHSMIWFFHTLEHTKKKIISFNFTYLHTHTIDAFLFLSIVYIVDTVVRNILQFSENSL